MADNENFEFVNKESRQQAEEYNDALQRSSDASRNLTSRLTGVLEKMSNTSDEAYRFLDALQGINDLTKEQAGLQEKVFKGQVTGDQAQKVADAAKAKTDALQKEYNDGLKGSKKLSKADKKRLEEKISSAKQFSDVTQKAANAAKLGDSSKSVQAADKISKLFQVMGKGKAAKNSKLLAQNLRGSAAQGASLMGKLKGLTKVLGKGGPAGFFFMVMTSIVKTMLSVNKEITALSKGLGISADESREVRRNLLRMSQVSGDIAVNFKTITKTFGELNAAFGTASMAFKTELLTTATAFRERMGLSAQATAELVRLTNIQGGELKQNTIEAIGSIKAVEKERQVRFDIKGILEETAKTSSLIKAQLGGSLSLLTESITKARSFGMELGQVAAAGKNLLNFEQSISNELEAELLTGKQINLERARLFALTNDYVRLSEELNREAGGLYEFSKLNSIQQESFAKSLGMSSEVLSEILLKNENLNALMEKARMEGDAMTLQNLQRLSAQQKFNYAIERLKDVLVGVVAYLESTGILDYLASFGEGLVNEGGKMVYKDPGTVGGGGGGPQGGNFQYFETPSLTPGNPNYVNQTGNTPQMYEINYEKMANANVLAFQNTPIVATMGRFENTSAINYNTHNLSLNNLEA